MPHDLLRICLIGPYPPEFVSQLRSAPVPYAAEGFRCTLVSDERELAALQRTNHAQVIVTLGRLANFPRLHQAPFEVRKRWLHYDNLPSPMLLGQQLVHTFMLRALVDMEPGLGVEPLVSVFTPAYRTGDKLTRAFRSLQAQTWTNWEWVVYDDSDDQGETLARLHAMQQEDGRVRAFASTGNCGLLGEVKRRAAGLCRGQIFLELDHDDELLPHCVATVVQAFRQHPQAGFAFSDYILKRRDGRCGGFHEWLPGLQTLIHKRIGGDNVVVTRHPGLCPRTIRMLRATPLHVRAWTREAYHRVGGWNGSLHVADDHEFFLRTFLRERIVQIPAPLYVYWFDGDNATTQSHVLGESVRLHHAMIQVLQVRLRERIRALGLHDPDASHPQGAEQLSQPIAAGRPLLHEVMQVPHEWSSMA